jgi:hypothetical protein
MTKKGGEVKKQWRRPELVVLERKNPDEAILVYCKQSGHSGPDVMGAKFLVAASV